MSGLEDRAKWLSSVEQQLRDQRDRADGSSLSHRQDPEGSEGYSATDRKAGVQRNTKHRHQTSTSTCLPLNSVLVTYKNEYIYIYINQYAALLPDGINPGATCSRAAPPWRGRGQRWAQVTPREVERQLPGGE